MGKWTVGGATMQSAMKAHMAATRGMWVATDRLDTFVKKLVEELHRKTELAEISMRLAPYFDLRGRPSGEELRAFVEDLLHEGTGIVVGLDVAWREFNGTKTPKPPKVVPIKPPPSAPAPRSETEELFALVERERDEAREDLAIARLELASVREKHGRAVTELAAARDEVDALRDAAKRKPAATPKTDLSAELRAERQRVIRKLIDAGMDAAAIMAALT